MTEASRATGDSAIGDVVVAFNQGQKAVIKTYMIDRAGQTKSLRAAEAVLDVSIVLDRPASAVWPVFRNFDSWMNRFGYVWEGLPFENENKFVYLKFRSSANDAKSGDEGPKSKYVVRKVIPGQLVYFDSQPVPLPGKDGVWSGHNLMAMHEENGRTTISVLMEHTWYSETMSFEELHADAKGALGGAVAFWRDYFVPDLISLVETGRANAA